jgi:nucleoside-diphosphate-sugar epimerase
MSSFNRIAVYGHRGWASSAIVDALIASGAPLKVLYRPDSDVSRLPDDLPKIAVDLDDEKALIGALQEIDILM